MKTIISYSTVQVAVYEKSLPALVALKRFPYEPLAGVIERVAKASCQRNAKLVHNMGPVRRKIQKKHYKHEVIFLDATIGANSLGELYGKLIDLLFDIAPEVVEKLAEMKARKRRYVARDRSKIHLASPHLLTWKTKSEWYVSKNVGKEDFIRGVKALCTAGNIKYGKDVRLSSTFA